MLTNSAPATQPELRQEDINGQFTSAWAENHGIKMKNGAIHKDSPVLQQHATTTWAQLITAFYLDGGSYKPSMVDILRRYLNQEQAEIAVLTLISDARRSQIPPGKITPRTLQARATRLSDEQIEELIACYLAGDSTYTLSRRFDIRRETVVAHLQRHGIARKRSAKLEPDMNQVRQKRIAPTLHDATPEEFKASYYADLNTPFQAKTTPVSERQRIGDGSKGV